MKLARVLLIPVVLALAAPMRAATRGRRSSVESSAAIDRLSLKRV